MSDHDRGHEHLLTPQDLAEMLASFGEEAPFTYGYGVLAMVLARNPHRPEPNHPGGGLANDVVTAINAASDAAKAWADAHQDAIIAETTAAAEAHANRRTS